MSNWHIFTGSGEPDPQRIEQLPPPPSWRQFHQPDRDEPQISPRKRRGMTFKARKPEIDAVNAALYLRRPLLITGKPGTGKTSLAYRVAYELGLGEVLEWPITTRSMLKDGLYRYDAIGRAQEQGGSLKNIGDYIQLGPLGTALMPCDRPRVLLIDEIDKSDIDLPNDLLNIFEEGRFEIPELARIKDKEIDGESMQHVRVTTAYSDATEPTFEHDRTYEVPNGIVRCTAFPLVIMTSNGERDFPAPFLRRCLRLTMQTHGERELHEIVQRHLGDQIDADKVSALIQEFVRKRDREQKELATDQLLNAVYLTTAERAPEGETKETLIQLLLSALNE